MQKDIYLKQITYIQHLDNISPLPKRAGIISVRADKEGSPTISFGIITRILANL